MKRTGVPFEALFVEVALSDFLRGPRAQLSTQADMFRIGDPRYLGRLLSAFAKEISARSKRELLSAASSRPRTSARRRLEIAVTDLSRVGASLASNGKPEPNDYHWLVIGALVVALDAVLPPYPPAPRLRKPRRKRLHLKPVLN